jgi:hypothetical protein
VVPAHITFKADGLGHFQMIAVQGEIDARFEGRLSIVVISVRWLLTVLWPKPSPSILRLR